MKIPSAKVILPEVSISIDPLRQKAYNKAQASNKFKKPEAEKYILRY